MEVKRWELEKDGFPNEVVDIIVQARRSATRWIYNYSGSTFRKWASNQSTDPLKLSYKDVVLFLHQGRKHGLKTKYIKEWLSWKTEGYTTYQLISRLEDSLRN